MFRITKILLGAICVMSIGSAQAGLTKYLGVSTKSVSPKGDLVAKSYYWSGELCICDRATGSVLYNYMDSVWWAYDYAWLPSTNQIIIFFKSKPSLLYIPARAPWFDIFDLDRFQPVAGDQVYPAMYKYKLIDGDNVLQMTLDDGTKVAYDLKNRKYL